MNTLNTDIPYTGGVKQPLREKKENKKKYDGFLRIKRNKIYTVQKERYRRKYLRVERLNIEHIALNR